MLDNLSLIPADISINNSQNNLNFGTGFLDVSNQYGFQNPSSFSSDNLEINITPQTFNFVTYAPTPLTCSH